MPKKLVIRYDLQTNDFDEYFPSHSVGFRTKNGYTFKNIMSFIEPILSQVNLSLDHNGISILSMDANNISLINALIPKELFSTYTIGYSSLVRGIDVNMFLKILTHLGPQDELIVSFNEDTLDIIFRNDFHTKYYILKCIDIDSESFDVKDMVPMTDIRMDSRYFNDIIKHFIDIGSDVRIKILKHNKKISFKSEGPMTTLKMIINNDALDIRDIQDLSNEYMLKYLHSFSKGYTINPKMTMRIGDGVPIQLSYSILDTGYIHYYLAPKIDV